MGIALSASGDPSEAESHFRRVILLQPWDAQSHFNLGVVLQTMGRGEEARQQFELTLQLDPNHAQARRAWDIGIASHCRSS